MASTPGQTSGAMLTLLRRASWPLHGSLLQPRSLPASRGASAPNEPPEESLTLGCRRRPSSHRSSVNVCFMNEFALGPLEAVFSLILREATASWARGKEALIQGEVDLAELVTEAATMNLS